MELNKENDRLYKLRHSLAHVLAQAILEVRPNSQLAFGPPIDTGCYYDFMFDSPLSPEDFSDIEKRMRRIIKEKQVFVASKRPLAEAIEHLRKLNQHFKVEYCEELGRGGEKEIGFYVNGPFEDMCAGPHLDSTGEIPPDCFKIDSIAGAYWRGSEKNPQLTRIYCLAFENKDELAQYIENRRLAQERDHRKLGKELELFMISDQVGSGLPLWLPNGTVVKEALEDLAKETEARYGYVRVSTPHIAKEDLYYTSGHLPYYKDSMFPPMHLEGESNYYLKAMNCPHHHMIYSHRPRSYRELPLRLAEYGMVYRYEPSGTLSGLLRVRSIDQNDAHIYCTLDQLKSELRETFNMALQYYKMFRFHGVQIRFSTHDVNNKSKFVDNPELWGFSEAAVKQVLDELQVEYYVGEGEAAFYGPKIDLQAKTLLGREESVGTTQLDFAQPLSFDLEYVGEDGIKHRPYIVHRAPLGAHERFVAFLIEHFGGAFPTWMAPIQVRIIPVNDTVLEYAREIVQELQRELVRVELDTSDNSFNKKIREAVTHKIPNIAIIGGKEAESRNVTLRRYCVKEQISLSRDNFIDRIKRLISERVMDNFPDITI
ncbi:MAG: threonine--tRNA ligase [Deltaproteobacteria bacterium]|nr:threonine--tRNA ligase [Deltaproteobacteria bacterium]